jgi:hypothetical protein
MRVLTFYDADLFHRYDKGWAVRSKTLRFSSHQPPASNAYAVWTAEAVGDPTIPSTQEIGVPDYAERTEGTLAYPLAAGAKTLAVNISAGAPPAVGWELDVRDLASGFHQGLGRVVTRVVIDDQLWLTCEKAAARAFAAGARVYVYAPAVLCTDNLFLPRRQAVRVEYEYGVGLAGPRPASVAVHRRNTVRGKPSLYFATQVAEIGAGEAAVLDAGYYAFVACAELGDVAYKEGEEEYTHHYNEAAAAFYVVGEAARAPGYLLHAGLTVRQTPQPENGYAAPGLPTLYLGANPAHLTTGGVLATRGDIFLAGGAAATYVGWNDHGFDDQSRCWFGQCRLGELTGGAVRELFVDRWGSSWYTAPAYELGDGLAVRGGALYGGRRRLERRWVRTGWQVVWAAPPQGNLPAGYDGGSAGVLMVPGDRTDLLQAGAVLRLGETATGEPHAKEYVVAEASTGVRAIGEYDPYALNDEWRGITAVFSWAVVMELGHSYATLAAQVRAELLGKYLTVGQGPTARHELWRFTL